MLASTYENDVALIHELWHEYASALIAGDIDRWISLWIREGIELSSSGQLLSGTEQIRAASQPVMDLFDIEMTIFPEKVDFHGECAFSYGSYRHAITPRKAGSR